MIGGPDVELSRLAKNRGRTALSMFARYAGAAAPVGDLLLLRRVIQAFKLRQRSAALWVAASPKSGPKRTIDSYLYSKREYVVAEVVAAGPDALGIVPGDRVLLQTNASLACPGCGRSADRREELDAERRCACARCGTRWRRDDGLNVGGCGFNPHSDADGPLFMRSSTYEVFHHAGAVLAVQRGGDGDMIEPGSVVEVRGERLMVRRVPEVEKVGSIHLPEVHREKPVVADVVAVGSGGKFEVGQRVLFGKFAGVEVDIGGEEHVILREEDVLAVITPPPTVTNAIEIVKGEDGKYRTEAYTINPDGTETERVQIEAVPSRDEAIARYAATAGISKEEALASVADLARGRGPI